MAGSGSSSGDIPDFSGELFPNASGGGVYTLERLYKLLGQVVHDQESDLNKAIEDMANSGSNIDQGALLRVQGMVQSWGVTSGLATGTLRAAGDALSRTTSNMR
ncbi:MAG: hypothetical protein LBB14_03140 [Puniceicoccales bacterium]|jgi:hypothetical protein|nr:hypothetical protein [Puniceicoccales bacterium]